MTTLAIARTDVPPELEARMHLAEILSESGILPDHLRGKVGNIVAIMMIAAMLDIPFMVAAQELYPVRGKIGMSAMLMRALVTRAGHHFVIVQESAHACTVQFTRAGCEPCPPVTYTMEEARIAELTGGDNYKKHPRAMMLARATSRCLRAYAADVLVGFGYTPDELRDRLDLTPDPGPGPGVGPGVGVGAQDEAAAVEAAAVEAEVVPDGDGETGATPGEPPMPATMGDLLAELGTIVPGRTGKTRAAAEARLAALWRHAAGQKWLNTPASDTDPKPVGTVILDRQRWVKTAPAGATSPDTAGSERPALEAPPPAVADPLAGIGAAPAPKLRRAPAKAGR